MLWFRKWIGREAKKEDIFVALKLRLARWRHLLQSEESCFSGLTDIREKLSGEYLFDRQYIFSSLAQIFQKAYQVAYDTGVLCGHRGEAQMYSWLDKQKEQIYAYLREWPLIGEGPSVVPITGTDFGRFDQVGEMASHLLRMMKKEAIHTPPGFVITIQGFLQLLSANCLDHYLQPSSSLKAKDWRERYQFLSEGLLKATIPEALRGAVVESLESLGANHRNPSPFMIWPSPMESQATADFPFAAQTWSGSSLDYLWDMLRSLWSRLYLNHGPETESFPGRPPFLSAMVCQRQISEGKSYFVRTLDPANPDGGQIIVYHPIDFHSFPPFNPMKPKEFRLSRIAPHEEDSSLSPEIGGWDPEKRKKLAQLSLRVENFAKRAQEILWEEDESGDFHLIQLRLQVIPPGVRSAAADEIPSLLREKPRYYERQGKTVCRGIASGPAVHAKPGQDLAAFPKDGILVAAEWSPEWKQLLPKVSAILIEQIPSPSLVYLARFFRIPTISQLPGAMKRIADQTVITVDAEDNFIYEKTVEPLLFSQLLEGPRLEEEPEYLLLEGVLREIDHSYSPDEGGIPPEDLTKCRTLREGMQWSRRQAVAVFLDAAPWQALSRDRWALPVTGEGVTLPIYAIDLGGGVAQSKPDPAGIQRTEIISTPWQFFWQGLNHLPLTEGAQPLFLILSRNTLFLHRSSERDQLILDTALSEDPELNHFFLYWEKGRGKDPEPGLPAKDCAQVQEIGLFRHSAAEVEELLKQAGQRLDLCSHSINR